MMEDIKAYMIIAPIASPAILVLVQMVKGVFGEKFKKFIPLVSVILGVAVSVVVNLAWSFGFNNWQAGIVGIMIGGAAVGLYEVGKGLTSKK